MKKKIIVLILVGLFLMNCLVSLPSLGMKIELTNEINPKTNNISASGIKINEPSSQKCIISGNSVYGKVYEYPTGDCVKGVKVVLKGFFGMYIVEDVTDIDGSFLFEDCLQAPSDMYVIEAFKDGFECNAIEFPGEDINHEINLWIAPPGSGKIYGYITDKSGNGVSDAKVILEAFLEDTRRTTTSSNGYYEFSQLDISYVDCGTEQGYHLNISKEGYETVYGHIFGLGENGDFIIQKDFTLQKSKSKIKGDIGKYKIYGYITLKDNEKSLEGVYVRDVPVEEWKCYSDENGYYELTFGKPMFRVPIYFTKDDYIFKDPDNSLHKNPFLITLSNDNPTFQFNLIAYTDDSDSKNCGINLIKFSNGQYLFPLFRNVLLNNIFG